MNKSGCSKCSNKAVLKRPKTSDLLCKSCFFEQFELEIHETIIENQLFIPGDVVAIGASGGKDSTVLASVLKLLNEKYDYKLQLYLLSIDEGIKGYRDDSLKSVIDNKNTFEMPLHIVSYEEMYGWSMDSIVKEVGNKNNCTYCGVFRRQALDRGAMKIGATKLVTGHNADDIAETVIMNILRGDASRFERCTSVITSSESKIPRCKPLIYSYEKEIVMYAHFKKLNYFATECIYAPNSYRGNIREYIKQLEAIQPSSIINIIKSANQFSIESFVKKPVQGVCSKCSQVSSSKICQTCLLLEGLNNRIPKLGISKERKQQRS